MIPRRLLQRCAAPSSIKNSVYALARSRHPARPHRSGGAVHLSTPPLARPTTATATRRGYSTTPDAHAPEPAPTTPADADADAARETPAATDEDPRVAELAQKTRELAEVKDRYRHAVADFRNLQDRTQRDMQAARDFALTRFAKDLIDSIDNLDRALAMVPPEKLVRPAAAAIPAAVDDRTDLVALYEGLKMTETVLMNTLKKHGVERFDPSVAGEKFNPNEHEALFMSPVPGKEDNTVFQTQQKGFKLNGRVLRAAKVGVVKNS